MEKNTRLTRQEAQEDMRDMMLSKDRALHLRKYNHILIITAYLNLSKLYRTLKKSLILNGRKRYRFGKGHFPCFK